MNKAHCWTSLRHFAVTAGFLAVAAGGARAQNASQVTVAVRGGLESFDKAASLDKSWVIGLDAMYGINNWLSVGPVFSLGRPNTTGSHFMTVLTYGVLNLGDTTNFYAAAQPISVLDGALNARVQLPGKKLSPYATLGVGGYTLFLDVQSNRGERHKVGVAVNAGAGLLYAFSDRAGVTFDVRSSTFTDYDRNILDPRITCDVAVPTFTQCPRVENSLFREDFKPAPKAKKTVMNFLFSVGFSYVPSFFGGGGGGQ
ncbi:MAG TPA: outer membrane beta-barrel protein [Gemmatimonadaceae bacterium]|nr:outer membrane beta-barrel protein [Gemmatimonadaceae bacterium]